jgi:hypothetical protein
MKNQKGEHLLLSSGREPGGGTAVNEDSKAAKQLHA